MLQQITAVDQSDITLTPYDAQIHKLEQQIHRLHDQLANANQELDDKLAKLQAANRGSLVAGKELIAAKARINQLERQSLTGRTSPRAFENAKQETSKLEAELCSARHEIQKLIRQQRNASHSNQHTEELERLLLVKSKELQDVQRQLREVQIDREEVLSGVNGLFADLQRVRKDAEELGCDIAEAREGGSGRCVHVDLILRCSC